MDSDSSNQGIQTVDRHIRASAVRIFVAFIPFATLGQVFNYMVRLDGKPLLGSIVVTGAAIISLAWLYLSTYVFHLGIPGSSIYYGLTIGLWVVLVFYFIVNKDTVYKIRVFGIPCIFILKSFMGDTGIWYGILGGCVLAFVLSMFYYFNERSRLNKLASQD